MKLIVKPFAEITIKSRPVRKQFIRQLGKNIRAILREIAPDVSSEGLWDNIDVQATVTDEAVRREIIARLKCIPGVQSFYEVEEFPFVDFDDIVAKCKAEYGASLKDKYFAVRCKRAGKHDFTSMDVDRYVGSQLRQQCGAAGIKMKHPDVEVHFEVRFDRLLMEKQRHQGIGGFPLGSLEQTVVLMSGGFDSTVAAYRMLRRGLLTHFCFFNLGGRAHELGVMEVAHYLWEKYARSHRVLFISVPFEEVVAEILGKVENSQMGVILKRMMLRASTKIAEELEIETLTTGEAVSQVSSQTLRNLAVIDKATDMLVMRPLIASHKQDIIDTAEKIGTAAFARNMPEYCGVISVNPTTRAKLHKVEREEERFDMAVLERAVDRAVYKTIDKIIDELGKDIQVEMVSQALANHIVIDIRHPDQVEDAPLVLDSVEVMALPFYAINNKFKELDPTRQYLLYCDKGVMSRLHAHHLLHEGFNNVRVYRPLSEQ